MNFSPDTQARERWRIPNVVFVTLTWVVVGLTWTLLIVAYSALPERIPSHFGFSGLPDAMTHRTWFTVLLPGMIQAAMAGLTWWLSRHPEYSNLPSTLTITALPEPAQSTVRHLLSHMIVMTGLIASLIIAYLCLGIVRVGLGITDRLDTWVILGLVGFLIALIAAYTVWLARITKGTARSSAQSGSAERK
jgi:uncharacterized membrane protein